MPKQDILFEPPVMNAAGMLGFWPGPDCHNVLQHLGAFITNPISLRPRKPSTGTRHKLFSGGFLNHTGHPNPGLNSIIRQGSAHWRRSQRPVLVHLLPQDAEEANKMAQRLEETGGVSGLEIGIPPWADKEQTRRIVQAATGELPVIVRLPFERAADLAQELSSLNITAVSLSPPRGALPGSQGDITTGRLYGPAIFPLALAKVMELIAQGHPVIAAGGVYTAAQVETMLTVGAMAVQIDAVLWRASWAG